MRRLSSTVMPAEERDVLEGARDAEARPRRGARAARCRARRSAIVPRCGRYTPEMQFSRLVLPAPFGPTMAWIVPWSTEMLTSDRALTPRKLRMMPVASSRATEPLAAGVRRIVAKNRLPLKRERRIFCAGSSARVNASPVGPGLARSATFLAGSVPVVTPST